MQEFLKQISNFKPRLEVPLSSFTTWRIGGPAEVLVEVSSSEELLELLKLTIKNNIEYTILGGGSNVLISDEGIRSLVIINKSKGIKLKNDFTPSETTANNEIQVILDQEDVNKFYDFKDLDYIEVGDKVDVIMDSGLGLAFATSWTFKHGLTGLQWFAGIPGTVGGALFNNIHGGTRHFSEYFKSATIFDPKDKENPIKEVSYDFFKFGYDQSVLREQPELVVISLTMSMFKANNLKDVAKAKYVYQEWVNRKKSQPQNTCGCVFKNISVEDKNKCNFPTCSTGYIIDKELHLVGTLFGNVKISEKHANFIENEGDGKAYNVLEIIKKIKTETKEKFGIDLETEIRFLGFKQEELDKIQKV